MKTMLMRIPVDVANEVAAAIQLSHCRGWQWVAVRGGAAFRICLVPGSKVQFGINLREFAYAAEDRKAA